MYKSCIHKVTFQCSRNIGNIQLESQLDRPKSNKSSLILRISDDLLDLGLSSFDSHWIFHQYTSGKPSIYWYNISLSGAKPPRRDILHISLSRNIPLWIQTNIRNIANGFKFTSYKSNSILYFHEEMKTTNCKLREKLFYFGK